MSMPERPDPTSVSHEAVAAVARQRVATLVEDVLLRDAKIQEQQAYIQRLEARLAELEAPAVTPPAAAS